MFLPSRRIQGLRLYLRPSSLFLNKCDLLKRKLNAGAKLANYMVSYGDRANDFDSIMRYFKSKFDAIRKQYSKQSEREFYVYATSVTVRLFARTGIGRRQRSDAESRRRRAAGHSSDVCYYHEWYA